MTNKLTDNKRRHHAQKILQKVSKKSETTTGSVANQESLPVESLNLKNQYDIIVKDIVQLKTDLAKAYAMAKVWMENKGTVRDLLRTR